MTFPQAIFKVLFASSHLVVPLNKTWQVEKVFVNTGDGYNIQVSKSILKPVYHAGDTIRLPYYTAEMELIENKGTTQYILHISETE